MERYQDFVFKDGKLIGRFEEMYQRCENPWNQCAPDYVELSKSRRACLLNIQKYQIKSVVEFGCGLGVFSDMMRRKTGAKILGVDISATAINKAATRFPHVEFKVDSVSNVGAYSQFDAILFAEITWYILEDLKRVFDDMLEHCRGKYFIHNLVFYKGDTQKYGREYFTNLQQFIEYCPFQLIESDVSTRMDPESTIQTCAIFRIDRK